MKVLFWTSAALFLYTYAGYPVCLWARGRFRARPVKRGPYLPYVSIILAVRNEEAILSAKLENLRRLNYPRDRTEIVIASDASTDGTNKILREVADSVHAVICETHYGKAQALNQALSAAK